MLKLILALLPLAANVYGQPAAAKTTTSQKAKVTTARPEPPSAIQGIPAGAVKIDENTYRFQEKDSSGKPGTVWLFRRNPFGVSKIEEREAAKIGLALPPTDTPTSVADLGDSYRFERPGPFGAKVWTKKKSDLTDEERSIAEKSKTVISTQKVVN